ncbi:MAG: SulP family inorganic anion transporter [Bacteroidia bacterium]|nr:SulP family inorganic anion transporter [Bacteroidia bacterium]
MKINPEFVPKLVSVLQEGITRQQLQKDIMAGIIVGIVALPLAIAFAIASGVSPEKGLITAIFAGFVISAFGGSRVQIGGPTGAFIVLVYAVVQDYGVEGLTYATLIAGFMILAMGLLRLGTLLKYIPHPLIVGFTSGIAVIIFSSQIKDFLGLEIEGVPSEFFEKWLSYGEHIQTINPMAVIIGMVTILITLYLPKLTTKLPGSLVAILICTLAVYLFDLPVDTIETKFGEIPNTLPKPQFKTLSFEQIKSLLPPAFAIALLGGIESLLSAVVADGMTGGRHRSNMELIAQGLANIVSGLIGGIPATGAIARTATNVKNGGRTPIAGIVHAITLLLIMLIAAPYAKLIPLSCLAGILIVVAYNMSEWHNFQSVFKGNLYDRVVLLTVFLLTVIFDLILAIEVGMILSAFLFIKRMSDIMQVKVVETQGDQEQIIVGLPKEIMIYEITGALFFGATKTFQEALRHTNQKPKAIILNLKSVSLIDATGLYRLEDVVKQFKNQGTFVYITEFSPSVKAEIIKTPIGEWATLHPSLDFCLNQAKEKLHINS